MHGDDLPEEEFPASLREVPLVWDVHQKIHNEIQCAPSDEIKLAVKCVHQIRGGPQSAQQEPNKIHKEIRGFINKGVLKVLTRSARPQRWKSEFLSMNCKRLPIADVALMDRAVAFGLIL